MSIKISELSTTNHYNNDDILLVSRPDNSIGPTEYITFNYKIHDFREKISNDVAIELENVVNTHKNSINNWFNEKYNYLSSIVNEHIEECELSHSKLTIEWNNLCVDLQDFIERIENQILNISADLDSKFNKLSSSLCSTIEQEHLIHTNSIIKLITDLSDCISSNYVSITGNQRITGQKTFAQDIIGTAMSARWA